METPKPKVSVVMPAYNSEKYIKEAVESVLLQTFTDFEFIIINDGSTDKTDSIIKEFSDERIKYFPRAHSGLINSLNFGLENSQGEFIARFDSDDICMPRRIEKQVAFFEKNAQHVLVGTHAIKIDENGKEFGEFVYPPTSWKEIKKYSLLHNPFIHPSVMFRKSILNKVTGYKHFKNAEDYELWTRIIYKYPCSNLPEKLLKYRIHTGQITKKNNMKMRISALHIRALAFFRFLFKS